jgi:hypothetical protein
VNISPPTVDNDSTATTALETNEAHTLLDELALSRGCLLVVLIISHDSRFGLQKKSVSSAGFEPATSAV